MSDVKLSNFPEGFPVHSFAPGVWVEWQSPKLIAVPDRDGGESCAGCVFAGATDVPGHCSLGKELDKNRVCSSVGAGMNFSNTVRIIPEGVYFEMRIKGEL